MSSFGPKGRAPSTTAQVAECQGLIDAHRRLQGEIADSGRWKVYPHNTLTITVNEKERIYLSALSWPRLYRWLRGEADTIKQELFEKYGIEVQ